MVERAARDGSRRNGWQTWSALTATVAAALTISAAVLLAAGAASLALPLLGLAVAASLGAYLSERRRAANAEAERRLLLESIEVTPTPYALYDADDRLVAWNPSYAQLHDPAFSSLKPPIRYEDLMRAVASKLLPADRIESAVTERVFAHRQGDGAPRDRQYPGGRWLRVSKQRTRSGAVAGFASDVTELKLREAELLASEARLRDYAEVASDWFWESDSDGRIAFISNRLSELGFEPSGWIGRTPRELAEADDECQAWREHAAAIAGHVPFRDLTFRAAARDGTPRYVALSGKPVFDLHGAFAGYRGGGRDVTDAINAANALREALEQAEVANRTKSQFLANMSHELRTPLNAIIGFSDVMKSGLLGPDSMHRFVDYAADIHASGLHLLDIINDMLDVAKIEAGRTELHEEPLQIAELAAEVSKLMADQAARARLTLTCAIEPDMPTVRADRRALRQILLNLVSNAVKFTLPGGSVTIAARLREDRGLRLEVRDTGIGVAPEDLPKLMQPFTQVDGVYQRRRQGTGLGLSLVRALAELHGGKTVIDSVLGRGTTVSVDLPPDRTTAALYQAAS